MSRRAISDDEPVSSPLSSPSSKSKYFTPKLGQSKTPMKRKCTQSNESKMISLVKRKQRSKVKCPMFMSSPSSVYACVTRYNSLLDALHGGDIDLSQHEDVLLICYIHFGACPIFVREFDTIIDKKNVNLRDIEEALIVSVRHLCPKECFLRAHASIREYTFLWRDLIINDGGGGSSGLLSPRRRLKKEDLLSGWSCKLLPMNQMNESEKPLIYISPDCKEFNTKSKAINYMNKTGYEYSSMQSKISLSKTQQTTATSSRLIDILNNINPQYSPFGLIEELFLGDPWKLLVSTICLNVTTRAQVDVVLYQFLQRWPDATTTANANWEEICQIITPLGLGTKRAKGLIRFSTEWVQLMRDFDPFKLTEKDVKSLYNIGQYGWTAYEVFILRRLPKTVSDHALELFVEYQLGRKLETG